MRTLSLAACLVFTGASFVIACGGGDKPPLTPDTTEPSVDGTDGGAAATSSAPASATSSAPASATPHAPASSTPHAASPGSSTGTSGSAGSGR